MVELLGAANETAVMHKKLAYGDAWYYNAQS